MSPKQKKAVMTNKLYGGVGPEILPETKGTDAIEELIYLNKEIRKLSALCDEYRGEIRRYEELVGDYRECLCDLRSKVKFMDWSPLAAEVVRAIEVILDIDEKDNQNGN
jgi:hypothetical protein